MSTAVLQKQLYVQPAGYFRGWNMPYKVGIVGAGIIGLSTALNVQRMLPGCDVTVMADAFTNLTSHGAAGMIRPDLNMLDGVDPKIARQWMVDSWTHFDHLAFSPQAAEAGVSLVSGYHFWDTGKAYKRLPILSEEFSYHFRRCTDKELEQFGKKFEHGIFFTTLQVESEFYLPWLTKRLKWGGVKFVTRKINKLEELAGEFDVVVNCTGLRSLELRPDPLMAANRGQMFKVKAPWIKHFIYTDSDTWIVPCRDTVGIGGTRQVNDSGTDVRTEDSDQMWHRAVSVMPSLQSAAVEKVWVGLRPARKPICVETELLTTDTRPLKVVHNYGHGGMGIAMSWGTSVYAAKLTRHLAEGGSTTAKL